MFYLLKKKASLGLFFGALLCLTAAPFGEATAATPQIDGGRAHSLTLDVYGAVLPWGENLDGQGTVPVPATGYVAISAGGDHNLAVKTDSTVVEWGLDVYANAVTNYALFGVSPAPVVPKPSILSNIIAVAGGGNFSMALKDTYTVVAWGDNAAGQATVPAALTGVTVTAIAAGDAHALALKSDGKIVGWGDNTFSQATGGAAFTGITAIAAGGSHSLALTSTGSIIGFGDNSSGQTTFPAGLTGVQAIAAGNLHSVYLKADGTVGVSGISTGGLITSIPAVLTNAATANVIAIGSGAGHALALQADGTLVVWGDDFSAQVSGKPAGLNLGVVVALLANQAPVPTAAAIAVAFNTPGNTQVSANDPNVSDTYTFAVTTAATSGTATVDLYSGLASYAPTPGYVGTDSFVVTVKDNGGLTGTVTVSVNVAAAPDTTPPVITVVNITQEATAVNTPVTVPTPTALDAVDGVVPVVPTALPVPTTFALGVTPITYTAIDAATNQATAIQTITITDTTAPVFTSVPVDRYVEVTATLTPVTVAAATATDIFLASVTNDASTSLRLGATVVTHTATDTYGNVAQATHTITVRDTTAPVFTSVPADVYVEATATFTPVNLTAPTATDIFAITYGNNALSAGFPVGPTVVTHTASDPYGNSVTTMQTVTITDNTGPVITLIGGLDIKVAQGSTFTAPRATAFDAAEGNITVITVDATQVNTSTVGTYPVTYNAADSKGKKAATVTLNVEVVAVPVAEPAVSGSIITTFAGGGTSTNDGVLATQARLLSPFGIAVDASGNVYFSDFDKHKVLKVDTDGSITTVAGTTGVSGFSGDGAAAVNAKLFHPKGIGLDVFGNLYIADAYNNRIRKVDTNGIITTVAGNWVSHSGDGGLATLASLAAPSGVALDAYANLYITEQNGHRVRRVDVSTQKISTVAGTGVAGFSGDAGFAVNAKLSSPSAVAIDSAGNLYIADYSNNRIRKVSSAGIITTVAGTGGIGYLGDGGLAVNAKIAGGQDLTVDGAGNIYFASGIYYVRKVDSAGIISTVAGNNSSSYNGDNIHALEAGLAPYGVALDAKGNLYITDIINGRVRKVEEVAAAPAKAGKATGGCVGVIVPVGQSWSTLMPMLGLILLGMFGLRRKRRV